VPTPTPTATSVSLNRPENPQIGLNFIRFDWDESSYYQPSWIFNDFADLGVQTYRQFIKADLLWNVVEPQDNQWDWSTADAVIPNADFEPIVTLLRPAVRLGDAALGLPTRPNSKRRWGRRRKTICNTSLTVMDPM